MKKIMVLTIMSALFLAGLAVAQPGHGDRHNQKGDRHGGPGHILKMADKLELTDSQTQQLETMAVKFQLEKIELNASIEKEQVMMKSLMRDDNVSESAVFEKIDKISALKAKNKKMQFTHRNAVQKILTDEQATKLKELRKNHRFAGKRDGDCNQREHGQHGRNFEGKLGDGDGRGFKKN